MHNTFLLFILLICATTISSMQLALLHSFSSFAQSKVYPEFIKKEDEKQSLIRSISYEDQVIQTIHDEIFATEICPYLKRPARDALRLTCTKYFNLVLSQDKLNTHYKSAKLYYDLHRNNKQQQSEALQKIQIWKDRGGLFPHQEFAHAIKNKQFDLARWLIEKNKVRIRDIYCENITEAAESSKIKQMLPVIKWLLYTRKPRPYLSEFLVSSEHTKNLTNKYPDLKIIVDLFNQYEDEFNKQKDTHQEFAFNNHVRYSYSSITYFFRESKS